MAGERKKILWLTEWFPTSVEPLSGDGIERRAKAASLYNDIFVIYVKKNPTLRFGRTQFTERIYDGHLRAFIYEYPSIKRFSRLLDLLLSNYYFAVLYLRALRTFKKQFGIPAGVQVNVTMKNGVAALYCNRNWKVPYIVVEGWSLFLPEEKPYFYDKDFVFRSLAKRIIRKASVLVTVSKYLGDMITRHIAAVPFKVVNSAVDTRIFFPVDSSSVRTIPRFIHISNLSRAKNIGNMLDGFARVMAKGYQAELVIYAPPSAKMNQEIEALGLGQVVKVHNETSQEQLANAMRESDALILFSYYETFGNVLIEAQACGLPVITSNYPVFAETVKPGFNGIIADGTNAESLVKAIVEFIESRNQFERRNIAEDAARRYSFERIGQQLDDIYREYF